MASLNEVMFPAKSLEIETAVGPLVVEVYPIRQPHLKAFGEAIERLTRVAEAVGIRPKEDAAGGMTGTLTAVALAVMDEALMTLVAGVCSFKWRMANGELRKKREGEEAEVGIADLPYWELERIVRTFFQVNLNDQKKILPLAQIVDVLLEKLLGQPGMATRFVSAYFSAQDTPSDPSSTNGSQAGPMTAGAPSSSTTS